MAMQSFSNVSLWKPPVSRWSAMCAVPAQYRRLGARCMPWRKIHTTAPWKVEDFYCCLLLVACCLLLVACCLLLVACCLLVVGCWLLLLLLLLLVVGCWLLVVGCWLLVVVVVVVVVVVACCCLLLLVVACCCLLLLVVGGFCGGSFNDIHLTSKPRQETLCFFFF